MTQPGPEFVAVIMASSVGTRLFPFTASPGSSSPQDSAGINRNSTTATTTATTPTPIPRALPKHLLPVAGIPILHRLLLVLQHPSCQFTHVIITILSDDTVTIPSLLEFMGVQQTIVSYHPAAVAAAASSTSTSTMDPVSHKPWDEAPVTVLQHQPVMDDVNNHNPPTKTRCFTCTVIRLAEQCAGTAEALRMVEQATWIPAVAMAATATMSDEERTTVVINTEREATNLMPQQEQQQNPDPLHQPRRKVIPSDYCHLVVLPADLVVLDHEPIQQLIQAHRQCNTIPLYYYHHHLWDHADDGISYDQEKDGSSRNSGRLHFLHDPIHQSDSPMEESVYQYHRYPHSAATILLVNVGEQDEHGVPLKESAKQKKGGLAREDEEIEYIALQYQRMQGNHDSTYSSIAPRLVWKQAKLEVETDKDMVGRPPQFVLPKARIRGFRGEASRTTTCVRTDYNDLHIYVLSPWIRLLLQARGSTTLSLRDDLLPLLIARQFKGVRATFGSRISTTSEDQHHNHPIREAPTHPTVANNSILATIMHKYPYIMGQGGSRLQNTEPDSNPPIADDDSQYHIHTGALSSTMPLSRGENSDAYAVRAVVATTGLSLLRSHTVPAYLHVNRLLTQKALECCPASEGVPLSYLRLPHNSESQPSHQSVFRTDTVIGDKVTHKSVIVGKYCQIGSKCRLNNVVLWDHVHVGENTSLQNTIVASGVVIGENCNLNDCQIGAGTIVMAGTKEKGEALLADRLDGF